MKKLFLNFKNRIIFLTSLLLVLVIQTSGQINSKSSFKWFVFSGNYTQNVKDYIKSKPNIVTIKLLSPSMIDPKNTGGIDTNSIIRNLARTFPDPMESGILCLDIENKSYTDLRDFSSGGEFDNALSNLCQMAIIVRRKRPNVKFGIYGLPYKTAFKNQEIWNANRKLDPLLKLCDYIFPSLYVYYPDKQKGQKANLEFLKENLKTALSYGSRLNKPVIPFIWYMIHTQNKRFGGEFISNEQMSTYLETIKSFSWNSNRVQGVVWWESSSGFFRKYSKGLNLENKKLNVDQNELFLNYMKSLNQ